MKLFIKSMVCDRCIMVVRQQLENLNFKIENCILGQVDILPEPGSEQLTEIASALKLLGFELIDNKRDLLVERIKTAIIQKIHHSDLTDAHFNFSTYLSRELGKDYSTLSRLFSESQEITVERYIIQQKIEKVKELLEYKQLNLTQIAWELGYSSSAHLSSQFKQITGFSPSQFKLKNILPRSPIDKI